jgi:hypothetical protein
MFVKNPELGALNNRRTPSFFAGLAASAASGCSYSKASIADPAFCGVGADHRNSRAG